MGNVGVTSLLGVVFWVLAARLYRPEVLGQDAALVAAMMLLSGLSQLSLAQGIPRLLPQFFTHRRLAVLGAYLSAGLLGTLFSWSFVVIAPAATAGFAFLREGGALQAVFVCAVVLWNVFALEDAVLTTVRWAIIVPVENGAFGLLKIGLLFAFAGDGRTHGVFFAWLASMVMVLPAVNWLLFARLLASPVSHSPVTGYLLPVADRARIIRYMTFEYMASLLGQGCTRLMPLLVLTALGTASSAYFYVDYTIAGAMYSLALAVGTSLVVEGAHNEQALSGLARRALLGYCTLLILVCTILVAVAPILLRPFGTAYVEHGAILLRLLLSGCAPLVLVVIYVGIERVRGQAIKILLVQALSSGAILFGAELLMARAGLEGVGIAWLIAWGIMGLAVLPATLRAARKPVGGIEIVTR